MAFKIEHYLIKETIGVGSFAKVKSTINSIYYSPKPYFYIEAVHEFTKTEVAIKIINK